MPRRTSAFHPAYTAPARSSAGTSSQGRPSMTAASTSAAPSGTHTSAATAPRRCAGRGASSSRRSWCSRAPVTSRPALLVPAGGASCRSGSGVEDQRHDQRVEHEDQRHDDGEAVEVLLHHRRPGRGGAQPPAEHVGQSAAPAAVDQPQEDQAQPEHELQEQQDDLDELHGGRSYLTVRGRWAPTTGAAATADGFSAGGSAQGAQCRRYWTIAANSSGSRLAPPTSAPSMSGWAISSAMLPGFTDPPYWIRTDSPASAPNSEATTARMCAHMACASSAVAVRPVPIAQIGSYAMTIDPTCSGVIPASPARIWH